MRRAKQAKRAERAELKRLPQQRRLENQLAWTYVRFGCGGDAGQVYGEDECRPSWLCPKRNVPAVPGPTMRIGVRAIRILNRT
jgi:hypothetical protein